MTSNHEDVAGWQGSISSKSTRETYLRYLQPVSDELTSQGQFLREATSGELQGLIDKIDEPGKRAYTAEALRAFFRWASEMGIAEAVPKLVAPRPKRRRRVVLTEPAVFGFLDALRTLVRDESTFLHVRQMLARAAVVAELAYSCGVTTEQIAWLKDEDIQSDPPGLSLDLGNGRRRVVPITGAAMEAIDRWRALARDPNAPASWLLHGRNEQGTPCLPVKLKMDLQMASRHTGKVGLAVHATALRQAFAQHMLDRGFDQEKLAYILGLTDLNSFQVTFLRDQRLVHWRVRIRPACAGAPIAPHPNYSPVTPHANN